ncbi:MAG: hypothetical protein FD138_2327, partial [Planctomycetota bacterium]
RRDPAATQVIESFGELLDGNHNSSSRLQAELIAVMAEAYRLMAGVRT